MLGGLLGPKVEFFENSRLYGELLRIVREAQEELILVSPYIQPNDDLSREIVSAAHRIRGTDRNANVMVIGRSDEAEKYRASSWFRQWQAAGVDFLVAERLHAKYYRNESAALVTSMNLSQSSWNNSIEIGFIIPGGHAIGEQLMTFEDRLLYGEPPLAQPLEASRSPKRRKSTTHVPQPQFSAGHCISCNQPISVNPERPFCRECYDAKGDPAGEFCHICGDSAKTSREKPRCYGCFKRAG